LRLGLVSPRFWRLFLVRHLEVFEMDAVDFSFEIGESFRQRLAGNRLSRLRGSRKPDLREIEMNHLNCILIEGNMVKDPLIEITPGERRSVRSL
jgi:hypothetical protein